MVSVIMPVFKVEPFIGKSIESVLNQTFTNFELLVIDDGSPDKSAAIAKIYAERDARIKVFHKPNGGLSDARNYGLDHAVGEFIYFIDSDDWIEPTLLEIGINAMIGENTNLVVFGYMLDTTDGNEKILSQKPIFHQDVRYDKSKKNLDINENLMGILGYAWNKIYRFEFLKQHNIRFEKGVSLVEDILFNAQVYQHSETLLILSNCSYHYLNRPVSTLIKKYHEGAFSLYLKKNHAVELFLKEWGMDRTQISTIQSISLMSGLRYSIRNLIAFMDGFSDEEKEKRISELTSHRTVRLLVDFYPAQRFLDWLYVKLVKFRMNRLLYFLLKFR